MFKAFGNFDIFRLATFVAAPLRAKPGHRASSFRVPPVAEFLACPRCGQRVDENPETREPDAIPTVNKDVSGASLLA
jgi:hypothetical protein